ncbi:hypothetical protein ZIOFF_035397 [Zingiber officinale]|uniref:Uncharacterized protein n=1 Tax=Zingiber officinale TaxID=94328 RepID=A0A8J5GGW4_ZINOF|nr:hypothetical protein ZIOFF_035397 [Zingiber officinale]
MEQVTILRQGKSLPPTQPKRVNAAISWDPTMFTAECLGPDLTLIPKQIRLKPLTEEAWDKYAGLVIDLSLSPRALPLLSFSRTKHTPTAVNSSAMKDQSPEAIAPAGMKISREIHYYWENYATDLLSLADDLLADDSAGGLFFFCRFLKMLTHALSTMFRKSLTVMNNSNGWAPFVLEVPRW